MSLGTLTHLPGMRPAPVWEIDCQPHIAIRLKRLFGRIRQQRTAVLHLKDTPEVARDLEWFLQRHPLDVDPDTMELLAKRADEHRAQERATEAILSGQPVLGLKDPARPPRPYRLQAADIVLTTGRLLLADDVGLGKTFSSLLVLRDPSALPALVVTLTHLPRQWLRELEASLPWLKGHIVTKGSAYDLRGHAPDVIVMNYRTTTSSADGPTICAATSAR